MISKELVEKFKKLYCEKFNTTPTDEEATKMVTDLINLMRILLKPDPKGDDSTVYPKERRQDEAVRTQQL